MASLVGRTDAFQKLALATTAITYLLILVGALVRASGAGLGCPDWPKCFGHWIPPLRAEDVPSRFDPRLFNPALMWTEYLNRLLGVATGFLIFATVLAAFVRHRREPRVLWPSVLAFLGVGYEGWLGGRVVAHRLAPWIVTMHLLVALAIVSLLLYATAHAFLARAGGGPGVSPRRAALGRAGAFVAALTIGQIAVGTLVRGGIDESAGKGLPRSEWLASIGGLDLAHRTLALLVVAAAGALLWRVARRERSRGLLVTAAGAVLGLALLQVVLGGVLAWLALPPPAQVAHVSVASLLLGAETLLVLLAFNLPEAPGA
jgi:cytochrome c oxidase assembly protein subunit 15